jgi:DNA-binding MarR family transcriptional regulator
MAKSSKLPASDAFGHLDQQLCFSLYAASTAMTRLYRPLLEELGITYPQYLTLLVLWEKGSIRLGEIADALNLASHAVSPIIDRLEQAGLARRINDPEDARAVIVELTKSGQNLKSSGGSIRDVVRKKTAMKTSEITRLRDELQRLVQILNEH